MLPMPIAELVAEIPDAGGSHIIRVKLLSFDSEGRLWVSNSEGRTFACDVLQVAGNASFDPGDELLVLLCLGQPAGVVLGRVGRFVPEVPSARVTVEATESLTLKCGEASIDLRADGKVMVRGEDVLLRAKGTQRIRAGTVSIN